MHSIKMFLEDLTLFNHLKKYWFTIKHQTIEGKKEVYT